MANMNDSNGSRVAVLIDYENALNLFRENIPRGQVDWAQVVATARRYGSVMICKAYADWDGNKTVRERILRLGIEPVTVPKSTTGKNGVDVKIAVDAIDMLVLRNADIRTLVLVSGDGDFTPLVNYLKDHGKYVVGMGIRGCTAKYLESACHDFMYLEKDNRGPDPIQDHPLIRQDTQPAAAQTVQVPAAAPPAAPVPGNGNGAHIVATRLDSYLAILRKRDINITPNEHRPLIFREAFAVFRECGWNSFMQTRDRLCAFFSNKYPSFLIGHVLDAAYQIAHASCLEWELSKGQYPADTSLWKRKARLKDTIDSPDRLLAKTDEHLIAVIADGIRPEGVDLEAASRILYGNERSPEVMAYLAGLIEKSSAPPPCAV